MDTTALSSSQLEAINAAFSYWLDHWNWEMPTLTGLTVEEFQNAAKVWRCLPAEAPAASVVGALGAVRECWAQARDAENLLGLKPEGVLALLAFLANGVNNAV